MQCFAVSHKQVQLQKYKNINYNLPFSTDNYFTFKFIKFSEKQRVYSSQLGSNPTCSVN